MSRFRLALILLASIPLTACPRPVLDLDGDGIADAEDCSGLDPAVFPGNEDPIDDAGLDANCDGVDGLDLDGDGYASNAEVVALKDCNDADANIWPGAPDLHHNPEVDPELDPDPGGVDTNCDGIDGIDADGDNHAANAPTNPDCNDADPDINPGQDDIPGDGIDNDCDGADLICDGDGDGLLRVSCGGADCDDNDAACGSGTDCNDGDIDGFRVCDGDCDDTDPARTPGAAESCDAVDNDCDDVIPTDELDGDADGLAPCAGDCDDADPLRFPGATEVCNGLDEDCDGSSGSDEVDGDGDGALGCSECDDADASLEDLDLDGDGVDTCSGDCDDGDPNRFPANADPPLDGVDGNCDGIDGVDGDGDGWPGLDVAFPGLEELDLDCDDTDPELNLNDADNDGSTTCGGDCDDTDPDLNATDSDSDGVDTCAGDCDDADPLTNPAATEACDGLDNDCDGAPASDEADGDGDGWLACAECDDSAPDTHPAAADLAYDGIDQDCDGSDLTDVDGDGFDAESVGGLDCDDDRDDVYPGAPDVPLDGIDSNCDDVDGVDGDGDGAAGVQYTGNLPPELLVLLDCDDSDPSLNLDDVDGDDANTCQGDCDDSDAALNPNDVDGDTLSTCTGDCDDTDAAIFPGALETCDGEDQDCDGVPNAIDSGGEADADGDLRRECIDCDDNDGANFPGNLEGEDNIDNDCDGLVDGDDPDYVDLMTFIPGGPYTRGCAPGDTTCSADESPAHEVLLPPFWIDNKPVPLGVYMNCAGSGGCPSPVNSGPACNLSYMTSRYSHPTNCIPWDGAESYCASVDKQLPSEAQWEKGARGTDERRFPWGNGPLQCPTIHIFGNSGPPGCGTFETARISDLPNDASFYGLLSMGGNVSEWVSDWYQEDLYQELLDAGGTIFDPYGPTTGTDHVFKGGSLFSSPDSARSSNRGADDSQHMTIGFRCAVVP